NARETHPIFFQHVLKGIHNGARLIVVDPRRTTSAQWADRWLGIDVGTDVALSNTIAREIIHAGLHNREFINRATTGFEAYAASAASRISGATTRRARNSRKRGVYRSRRATAGTSRRCSTRWSGRS